MHRRWFYFPLLSKDKTFLRGWHYAKNLVECPKSRVTADGEKFAHPLARHKKRKDE